MVDGGVSTVGINQIVSVYFNLKVRGTNTSDIVRGKP